MPVSRYFKLSLMGVIEGAIAIGGFFFVTAAFANFGIIAGGITLVVFVIVFFGFLYRFINIEVPSFMWEEEVVRSGTKLLREIIVKDPKYGTKWFDEKGYLAVTQRGCYFYYGYPFIFSHKKMIINMLTNSEVAMNPIVIEGAAPEEYPDGKYVSTSHKITVKGGVNDWAEQKQWESGIQIVNRMGSLMREGMAASPNLPKIAKDISVDDLLKMGF